MLSFLPPFLRTVISTIVGIGILMLMAIPFYSLVIIKVLLPFDGARKVLSRWLQNTAQFWMTLNNVTWVKLANKTEDWTVSGLDQVDLNSSYLLTSNHQSWNDIMLKLYHLTWKTPGLKFFLKQELIYVPLLGGAWWALDYPFMKRYSKAYITDNPHMKGKDIETTKQNCQKYKHMPVTVINYAEGTRFTQAKHDYQQSPYQNLLKPKSGGLAFAIEAMDGNIRQLLDITLVYKKGENTFGELANGTLGPVHMDVEVIDIPESFIGKSYQEDEEYRAEFQTWVSELWAAKDAKINRIREERFNEK